MPVSSDRLLVYRSMVSTFAPTRDWIPWKRFLITAMFVEGASIAPNAEMSEPAMETRENRLSLTITVAPACRSSIDIKWF
jgi:hypothetical protein